jgi:hypothetical protein
MCTTTKISREIQSRLRYPEVLRLISDFREVHPREEVIAKARHGARTFWVDNEGMVDCSVMNKGMFAVPPDEIRFHVMHKSNLAEGGGGSEDYDPELLQLAAILGPTAARGVDLGVIDRMLSLLRAAVVPGAQTVDEAADSSDERWAGSPGLGRRLEFVLREQQPGCDLG